MKRLLLILVALYCAWFYFHAEKVIPQHFGSYEYFGSDFRYYYHAAQGDFSYSLPTNEPGFGGSSGFIYREWTAALWKPFLLFPSFESAWVTWYIILVLACLAITNKLLELKHGWILLIPAVKIFGWSLQFGNVYPVLILGCFSPWTLLLSALVKPQLLCIVPFVAIIQSARDYCTWRKLRATDGNNTDAAGTVDSVPTWLAGTTSFTHHTFDYFHPRILDKVVTWWRDDETEAMLHELNRRKA